nr:MAG TPA: hypothetical protein [Caudoviricetes sp.]
MHPITSNPANLYPIVLPPPHAKQENTLPLSFVKLASFKVQL